MQLSSLVGKKIYQKQGFLQDGTRVPLSGVRVLGNVVTQIKTADKEGYNALQLGIETKKKANKSLINHSKKAGLEKTSRFLKEVRIDDVESIQLGSEINVAEVFAPGDIIDVTGVSKGKGFAGGVKRHHFKGGPRTHGQSDRERAPGSIGQSTTPGRVYKGKRMAGRMGHETATVKNLEVIAVTDDGVLLIKGLVPGGLNSIVVVKKMGTDKKFVPLYKEELMEEKVESHPSVSTDVKQEEIGSSQSPVSDDAQAAHGDSQSSTSDDVQPVQAETQSEDSASLSDSRQSESEEEQEKGEQATINSSESVQPTVSLEGENKEEVKEEGK
jgi:large subunit ribosomal protein L3